MTRIAELQDRLRRLAKRREGEGIYTDAAICEEAAEALSRASAVKVKALEWEERVGVEGTFDAYTSIGHYIATITDDELGMWFVVGLTQSNYCEPDIGIVKAAAQADYERRIRSTLEPAAPEGRQDDKPVAWVRKWNFRGTPRADEFTDNADRAEQWRTHPQTNEVIPLYTRPTEQAVTEAQGWRLMPDGDPVELDECPEGLFLFGRTLVLMTEYARTHVDAADGRTFLQRDAYIVASGEYFWGGTSDAQERARLIVQPLLPTPPINQSKETDRG